MFICIQIKTQTPQYLPYMTPAEKMIYRLHTSSYLIVTNCRCFITVFYTDRHKILYDLLICNKKPRSFVRNRVFVSQSIFPPAWFYRMEPFNGLSYIGIAIMIPIRNLLYFGNFMVLQLQERGFTAQLFYPISGFWGPASPAPWCGRSRWAAPPPARFADTDHPRILRGMMKRPLYSNVAPVWAERTSWAYRFR